MSLLLRSSRVIQKMSAATNPAAAYSSHAVYKEEPFHGNREIVGHGSNGSPIYVDRPDYPLPAIRYKAPTPDIQICLGCLFVLNSPSWHAFPPNILSLVVLIGKALREKEKGDWKKLSIEDKKQLYRATFCQTFAEMNAPTGEWKSIFGCVIGFMSLTLWLFMAMKLFVYPKELPPTFSLERRQAQLQRMIDIRVNPIDGLTSNWDYEKNEWKK